MAPPKPLLTHPRCVHTRDLDETAALVSRLIKPVRRDKLSDKEALQRRGHCLTLGPVTLTSHRFGCGFAAKRRSIQDLYSLSIPLGACGVEGSRVAPTMPSQPGEAAWLAGPGHPSAARMRTDHERISLEVHAHDMEAALSALVGATPRSPLRFEPRFSLEAQPAAALLRLLRFVMQEAEHDVNAFSSPLAAARVAEALLVSVLLAHPHNHSALIDARTRAAEPEHVRLVADYLEANLTRPISMAELSELSGVSVRSIQVGFRKFRGCSPVEFLRTRRLVRARTALSTTHLTVSQVAFACGFEHLGRFSAQYKAHFGEYPTETRSAGLGSLTARARAKTPIRTTRPARIG